MKPRTPTTALSLSNASVTAGSSRSTRPAFSAVNERRRQGLRVDLEAERERCFRAQSGADAAVRRACDGLVQTQRAAQNSSSPKVSKRKVSRPRETCCTAFCRTAASAVKGVSSAIVASNGKARNNRASIPIPGVRSVVVMARSPSLDDHWRLMRASTIADDRVAALSTERECVAHDVVELAVQRLLKHAARTVEAGLHSGRLDLEQLGSLRDAELLDPAQHEDLPKLFRQPIDRCLQDAQQVAARCRALGPTVGKVGQRQHVLLGVGGRRRAAHAAKGFVDWRYAPATP